VFFFIKLYCNKDATFISRSWAFVAHVMVSSWLFVHSYMAKFEGDATFALVHCNSDILSGNMYLVANVGFFVYNFTID